jgi:hypothetical protein
VLNHDLGRARTRRPGSARSLAIVIALVLAGCPGPDAATPRDAPSTSPEEVPGLPPEGQLLLYTNDGPVVLRHSTDQSITLQRPGEAIWADDLSPDGSKVLALPFQQEPTGITREPRIVVIATATDERSTAVRVGPKGDLGPALWSPDGTGIAYRLTVYGVNPAKIHPYRHGQRTSLCTLDLQRELASCFSGLGRIDGFDWSPDGGTLVVDIVGPEPLWLLDPSTGQRSILVPAQGGWIERAGLREPVTFTSPRWSPSGRFVAAWVNNTPVVFHADGRFAATGRHSQEFSEALGWSPSDDLFAYTRGEPPYFTEIRLLDPVTGRDRRLLSAEGYPYITGLAWSPSGRWLAVLWWRSSFRQVIDVIDVESGDTLITTRRDDSPVLVDWGP